MDEITNLENAANKNQLKERKSTLRNDNWNSNKPTKNYTNLHVQGNASSKVVGPTAQDLVMAWEIIQIRLQVTDVELSG